MAFEWTLSAPTSVNPAGGTAPSGQVAVIDREADQALGVAGTEASGPTRAATTMTEARERRMRSAQMQGGVGRDPRPTPVWGPAGRFGA